MHQKVYKMREKCVYGINKILNTIVRPQIKNFINIIRILIKWYNRIKQCEIIKGNLT